MIFLSPELPAELATYCYGCRQCERCCPVGAIHFLTLGRIEVDRKACWKYISSLGDEECWECSQGCRKDVLKMSLFEVLWADDTGKNMKIRRKEG